MLATLHPDTHLGREDFIQLLVCDVWEHALYLLLDPLPVRALQLVVAFGLKGLYEHFSGVDRI